MEIANLLKNQKTIVIGEYYFKVRKLPLAFIQFHLLKANGMYIRDSEGKAYTTDKNKTVFKELAVDYVEEALISWNLKDPQGVDIPISRKAIEDLQDDYSDFFSLLDSEIRLFNSGITEDTKKKSKP